MIIKESLTNEKLSGKFRSQFDLVNYSIKLAENMIKTGRGPRLNYSKTQNRSCQVLEEIVEGVDKFDDVLEYRAQNESRENERHSREHASKFQDEGSSRPAEKKKARLARIEVASLD